MEKRHKHGSFDHSAIYLGGVKLMSIINLVTISVNPTIRWGVFDLANSRFRLEIYTSI